MSYWTNFAKTGDPNSKGVAPWPKYEEKNKFQVMYLSATPHAAPDEHRAQYEFLAKSNHKPN